MPCREVSVMYGVESNCLESLSLSVARLFNTHIEAKINLVADED